ncbi:hypothetical protein LWI28_017306 [Acer negundo]|uniref:Uncharacterized protein n=1 Tax=Acer negundo TaxID=4023 RepID=A0AAD5P0W0_ACENE|nr:hypothetical protein LWI28_017306 [Acer negundo]
MLLPSTHRRFQRLSMPPLETTSTLRLSTLSNTDSLVYNPPFRLQVRFCEVHSHRFCLKGSKYGIKGNDGTWNIGKAGNEGRMRGGGFQDVKTGVVNISIDGVLGNWNVENCENYRSKNGKTSKNAFDKVGGSRFEVLNEEMDEVVNDVAREQKKVGGS